MKKNLRNIMFLFILTAMVTLVACGSSEKVTLEGDVDGATQIVTFEAKKDKIEKVEMKIAQTYESLNMSSKEEAESTMGELMEEAFASANESDGVDVSVGFEDEELIVEANIDFTKADTDALDEIGMGLGSSLDDEDLSLEKAVSDLESQGFEKK
ncbi:DUF1307 domain-containing protein [Ornithinibacillus sp. 4-3]|uniref:DUF1307 domain-containing protein n=1 Tax=Ornithinibacillus sp. 4-3 TaxID=3231488 RepID=A0AB39HU16_9BACI